MTNNENSTENETNCLDWRRQNVGLELHAKRFEEIRNFGGRIPHLSPQEARDEADQLRETTDESLGLIFTGLINFEFHAFYTGLNGESKRRSEMIEAFKGGPYYHDYWNEWRTG